MTQKRILNLIFLGPPGAGKGTQARMIMDKYSIPQISTGDLMRNEISSGSSLGERVKSFIESGKLVPDELTLDIVLNRLSKEDCKNGYLLDGFPRTLGQAEALEKALHDRSSEISSVIALEVDDSELTKRLADRRICKNCGDSYHLQFKRPLIDGKCDHCGGELYQRRDDSEEVIKNRLKTYHEQTASLKVFYGTRKKLKIINGKNKIDVIFSEICAIIDELETQV